MNSKKQMIIKSALQLFIKNGVDHTSLQDILDATSISKGTFYKYFSSKDKCITEIIEQGHTQIRTELTQKLIGQSPKDKDILKEQFILHLKLINDYHLYDLFRAIRQGQDKELHKIIIAKELSDIQWMSDRVVEVFGKEFQPYSREATTLYYGMVYFIVRTFKITNQPLNFERIATVTMRYLEMILHEMLETKQVIGYSTDTVDTSEGTILNRLKDAQQSAEGDDKQLIEAMIEELQRDQPRTPIVHALAKSLSNSWKELKLHIGSSS